MRDAYERFFESLGISPDDFFDFGLREVIHVPFKSAQDEWAELKHRIESRRQVAIRHFGSKGRNTWLFLDLYSSIFSGLRVFPDATNNAEPTKLLRRLTGFSKTARPGYERLSNYQVSHVFGRTKNPYAFTAPWNVVYIPKIVDPFTGHEAPGYLSTQFQQRFRAHMYAIYKPLVDEFNDIISDEALTESIDQFVQRPDIPSVFLRAVREAFSPITIETG